MRGHIFGITGLIGFNQTNLNKASSLSFFDEMDGNIFFNMDWYPVQSAGHRLTCARLIRPETMITSNSRLNV